MHRDFARKLRRCQTPAEHRLWHLLRDRRLGDAKFRRQMPVGPYIADFLCVAARLIVEVDGGQHAGSARDAVRDAWLEAQGWRVVRFWNGDVLANPVGVCDAILEALTLPSPASGRG
jgi:very-short-patch-repair endonuclease